MKKIPDVQPLFRAHLEASLNRDAWAKKGLELQQAGKIGKAREALRQAERYDFQRREIVSTVRSERRVP